MVKHIHVIINPATRQDRPLLGILNSQFHSAGIDWDVFITKKVGDARRLAQASALAGVDAVAVYGGDGTVMEAASGLVGTEVPLAIFPGGTANVLSVELGIPGDLTEACALACSGRSAVRRVDLGQVGVTILLSVGVGFAATVIEGADRELKKRFGMLAYWLSGFQALREPAMARYRLTLDGQQIDTEGITCMIANSGNLGQLGLKLSPSINVSDGLLDVICSAGSILGSFLSVAAHVVAGNDAAEPIHWQARRSADRRSTSNRSDRRRNTGRRHFVRVMRKLLALSFKEHMEWRP
jgi:diacylglycerol kinase family enzyme